MPGSGPTVFAVRRLRVYTEPAGSATFAVDHTGTLGDFTDVPAVEGSVSVSIPQDTHDPGQQVQNTLDYREEVLGRKSWELSFDIALGSTAKSAGDATAQTSNVIGEILTAIWGGEHKGTGTTVATGGWAHAETGSVAAGGGAGLEEGGWVALADTAGVLHARELRHVTGDIVRLKIALPFTPASGDVVYAASTYYPTQDPDTSLQFIAEGLEQNDRWVLMGGQGTVTFALGLDGTPQTASFTISGVKWIHASDAAGSATLNDSDLGTATYSNWEPIAGHAGRFMWQTVGTRTYAGATVDISAVSIEPQLAFQEITSPSGVEGRLRHRLSRQRGAPIQGSHTTYFEAESTYWDEKASKTDKAAFYQVGVSAGRIYCFSIPTVQVLDPQVADDSGIAGVTVTWKGRLDGDTSAAETANDLSRAPFRFAML